MWLGIRYREIYGPPIEMITKNHISSSILGAYFERIHVYLFCEINLNIYNIINYTN